MPSQPESKQGSGLARQIALAAELPITLVACVLVGGGAGWLLDRWWHTSPAMTLVFGLFGFAGGILQVLRTLNRKGPPDARDDQD